MHFDEIERARALICNDVKTTPVLPLPLKKGEKNNELPAIYLKCENEQVTSSFKPRGAFTVLRKNLKLAKEKGVVTRSSGNFAQAVAYASKKLGIPAHIVMSTKASPFKIKKTQEFGVNPILCGTTHEEGEEKVKEIEQKNSCLRIAPYDHDDVIAGQGTLALELLEQLPNIGTCFCPIGGGGLASGCAFALKTLRPSLQFIGVEPELANDYYSLRHGVKTEKKELQNPTTISIADGLLAPQVGKLNLPILNQYVDTVVTVSEVEIIKAMQFLYEEMTFIIEPSGAVAVAAMLQYFSQKKGEKEKNLPEPIVCIVSGGNIQQKQFLSILNMVNKK